MLRSAATLFLAAAFVLHAGDSDAAKKFLGEWNAKYKDTVVCTIRLTAGDPIDGQSENCNLNVDANGDLQEPDPSVHSDSPSPILNPRVLGSTLAFEEKEGDETLKFEFTLVADGKAELKIIDAPVAVKPIPFSRKAG